MCWNPVNMPGCGRDGGFVAMKLRLDHHLPRRPCTFLHEMGGFTHEWSLQLLPFDEGIYLMCKSFVKGQYLRWLQLSRLVFACHKPSSIFANCQYLPQSFEVISLSQKSNQINLAGKVKFESIYLESVNKCLVRIVKLGGWWWFEKMLLESFAHSPARLCYFVNSVFGRRASEWFSMRLNKSGC